MIWGPFARSVTLVAALAAGTSANAGDNNFILGMGVGIIGNALMNGMNQQADRAHNRRNNDTYEGRRYLDDDEGVARDPRRDARNAALAAKKAEDKRVAEANRQELMAIQTRLKALNFDIDSVDGKNGGQTKTAIKAFQASVSAPQTGVLDENQKRMLIAQTTPNPNQPVAQPPMAALQPLDAPTQTAPSTPQFSGSSNLPPLTNTLPTPGNLQLSSAAPASATVPDAAILGVKPLQSDAEAHRSLASANIAANCHDAKNSIVCLSQSAQMTDEIVIGTTALDTTTVVHSAIRTMKFTPPIARAKITSMLSTSYPSLMSGPVQVASSGRECNQVVEPYRANDFAALKAWIKSGADADETIAKLSSRCSYYDEISIPAGDTVPSISITLFSGKPIFNSLSEVGSIDGNTARVENVSAAATPDIKF